MAEYVKFSGAEKVYGEKSVLGSELELLQIIKRLRTYKGLRREELVLRLALKNKISEIEEDLKKLDKLLPHHHMQGLHKKRVKKVMEEVDEDLTLEQELEVIRRKLDRLKG